MGDVGSPDDLDAGLADAATDPARADPVGALARELATAARRIGVDWTVEQVQRRLDGNGPGSGEGISRGGKLSTTRYEQLGGVQGTLTRQAERR